MGVKGWDFIPWRWSSLKTLQPKAIAIDVFNYMIRRMSTIHKVQRSHERIPFAHISISLGLIRSSLRSRIIPVFVFEGPPETLKREADSELVRTANNLFRWYAEEGDPFNSEIAEALHSNPSLRTYFAAAHMKELCSAIGVPVVNAPSEAEMMAAVMCREGLTGTVASNDIDAILFGSPHVSRSLQLSKGQMECVTLNGIREVIDLELEELKDLAVVCGCDFHREGVKGIGPRKGTLLLRRHGGLEGLLKARGYTHSQREPFLQAREVFDEGNYISIKHLDLSLKSPIIPRLHRILKPVMGEERAAESTETLVGLMKQFYIVQDTLEAWV